ncbi:OLC1v1008735C1 [Oldenlandia corymbosa var. corymbosa]|uniref:OLC1v1008735C1 n=1 Tax=Oldenlandia corymbosa var. corymbosa TaxID=529605 RepID=A0AAV1DPP8_OLDCO|nr:OLC1v1008735C1 [Oldenlandia corymbosa var. corymbosa]
MLGFDERDELFFDAEESLSSESIVSAENIVSDTLGYGIWLDELKSVKERRESFLVKMGLMEVSSSNVMALDESETTQRVVECGGAVSSSCTSSVENYIGSDCRESNGEANCMIEESSSECSDDLFICTEGDSSSNGELEDSQAGARAKDYGHCDQKKKKTRGWLKVLKHKMKNCRSIDAAEPGKPRGEAGKVTQIKVEQKKKKFMEFTAVYAGQEINGHKGLISTMKFSPDGQFVASGGEDGIVRIWSVSLTEAVCSTSDCNVRNDQTKSSSSFRKKRLMNASVILPKKVFHINELPLHEFHGHTADILDLAWSSSNQILSASKDNTVRLWQVGSNGCLGVFLHTNYVTCIQFNPIDDRYFISGSIDGKLRIWGVPQKRVVDWADTRDVVSAVCYQPNGKGFVAGCVSGICHFYELHGTEPSLHAEMHIGGRKKSSGNRITGIKYLDNDSHRVMITSEDSKIRILDGLDIVHKYRGPTKSGSQTSASFTSSGQHIVSVGDDSRICIWNYDNLHVKSSKAKKSARACEYFFSHCASVAIPWSGMVTEKEGQLDDCASPVNILHPADRDQDRFSLTSWFSMDISSKGAATWPAEKLPLWEVPRLEQSNLSFRSLDDSLPEQLQKENNNTRNCQKFSATWGTVIVTAGWDGKIRTFHNFGLPIKS